MWSEMEWSIRRLDGQRKKKSGLDRPADKSKQEEECSTSGKNEIRKGQMLRRCRKSKRNSPSTCSQTSGATAYGGKDQLRPDKRGKVQHLETREQESLGATCSCASQRQKQRTKIDREGRSETRSRQAVRERKPKRVLDSHSQRLKTEHD
jgi:hypothetical protein